MTNEDKAIIRAKARSDGFEAGVDTGRALADQIDTSVYARTDLGSPFEASIYYLEYVRSFFEGLQRAFKRRADEHAAARHDIRMNAQRKQKEEQPNEQ